MGVLKIKFEYWNFEKKILKMEVLKIGILKSYLRTEFFLKLNLENYLKIGILKNYLRLEFF